MTTQSFANKSTTDLSFTNITISEVDVGDVAPLIGGGSAPVVQSQIIGGYQALDFAGFTAGAYTPASSVTVTLTYDVTSKTAGLGITALQQGFTPDGSSGAINLIITEKVYDSNNNLVGSTRTDLSRVVDPTNQGYAFGDLLLTQGYASLHVVVTLTAVVLNTATSDAYVFLSDFEQGFQVAPIATAPLPGTITGRVFLDQNADGAQVTGDANLSGVTVQLLDSNGNIIVGVTAVTDANGAYSFTGLASGNYAVVFTPPAGDRFSPAGTTSIVNATGQTAQFAVAAGGTTSNINAGVYVPATLTAHVYSDTNKDGTQGTGEAGSAGVVVQLLTGAGVATGITAVTDANGNVTFSGLVPGSYQVAVVPPAGQTATQVTNIGTPITLTSGQTVAATEGLFNPGTLTGRVFLDQNADGVFMSGDTNLSGIVVQLLDSTGAAIAGKSTTTDSNGNYSFTGLVPGSYAVAVTAPSGNAFSQVGTNANAALDSIVNGMGKTTPVAVTAGNTTPNQNAAVYVPATLTAHVYSDVNKDNTQGTGEGSLSGITVKLLTGAGVDTGRTAITDANGNVSFTGLVPGSYQIDVVEPNGQTITQASNVNTPITLTSGQTVSATEGLFNAGALTGRVFLDQNADGVFMSGDTNLSGIVVQLLDSTGAAIAGKSTTTDSNGNYSFTGLVPGSYAVAVTAPSGNAFSQVGTNANAALDSIVNGMGKTTPVAVTAGNTTANQNAAVYVPATLTAHVYSDVNKDNTQGTGEGSLSGITVKLLTGAGVDTGRTAITDANGNVSFTGLVPGSYQIDVVEPNGQTITQASNVNTPITLTSGQTVSATEGLFNPGALSGRVFLDQNADGVFMSGDTNLSGIVVQLLDSTGAAIAGKSTTTDSNGNYSFTGLVPGSYAVAVTAPSGNAFSQVGTNANAALDSIVNGMGKTTPVAVTAGNTTPNQNAAVYVPATLTAHVYSDVNKDNTQGTGEGSLSGITVKLLTGAGVDTGRTAITDANGNVSFTGLVPGSYQIDVVEPNGQTITQASNVNTPITLTSGQTVSATEGLFNAGALTGRVFLDQNADGVFMSGDTNLSGIVVQLLDSTGAAIAGKSTTTDSNGNYSFTGLVPGSYAVAVTAPSGNAFSQVGTNANAALDSIVNGMGKTTPVAVTAGNTTANQNAAVYVPATLTAHVYSDTNKDGTQGTGEAGSAGVVVQLLTGAGVATGITAVTDANGNVTFSGLVPGSYQVAVVPPAGQTATQVTNIGTPITLTSGQTVAATEGLFNPGTLTGRVFLDQNADGVFMSGDTNLSGIVVQLLDSAGVAIAGKSTTTDSNGNYSFTGLVPGSYAVAVTAPTGNAFSQVGTNANAALDSIVNSMGKTTPVAVTAGNTTANQNAAVYAPATFITHVYNDVNKDGTQNTGDTNAAGVLVQLLTGAGVATGITAVTDANGNVTFSGLVPGSYQVAVVETNGATFLQHANVDAAVTLTSGQTVTGIEGLVAAPQPGALSGRLFADYNADGVYNNGAGTGTELISNGSFEAQGVWNYNIFCNGQVTGWTSNNNELEIDNAGAIGQPASYAGVQSLELNGTTFDTISQTVTGLTIGQSYQLSYAYAGRAGSGNQEMDVLFNGVRVATNTSDGVNNLGWQAYNITIVATSTSAVLSFAAINVGGNSGVGNELDGVSLKAVGAAQAYQDVGIAGRTVTLLTGTGGATGLTTVTDATGNYSFTNLAAGNYEVQFAPGAGTKFSQVGTNPDPALDSIVNGTGLSPVKAVVAGATTPNLNAGEYKPATFIAHIYNDLNRDGTQNTGDTNMAGITVNLLTGTGAATGITAITDASGNATFAGLTPGSYEVSVATPAGKSVTQATNVVVANTLLSGQVAYAVEGLAVATGALSGRVFGDFNADGVLNTTSGNDYGLSGQTVQLLNGSGQAITGVTAITDGNGNYTFSNLVPGSYQVQVIGVPGARFSQLGTNANAALDSVVNASGISPVVTVTSGATTQNVNAGEYLPATIVTHVYNDVNKDGTQGSGESSRSGVTVQLLTGTGAATGTTAVTDANGNATFAGLNPGNYQVAVIEPGGTTITQLTNVDTTLTLAANQTLTATEGLFTPGALSGRIFGDYNADGVFNTTSGNDFGLSGQTVQLLNGSGQVVTGVTAITDGNGNYSFGNLVPGSYQVQVVAVPGAKFSQVGTNANAALDSVVNASGISPVVTVTAGATTQNVNAGEYTPGTITAHVYTDTNKDGSQGAGETARAGVTVNLLTGTGASTGLSAVTDSNGNVSFAGLAPGSYKVDVAEPTGTAAKQLVNVDTPVTLAVGQTINAVEGLISTAPSLTIHKTASVSATTPGTVCPPLTYTFVVTNTGTTALTGVKIVDVTNGDASKAETFTYSGTLAAGASWTYTTAPVTVSATKGTIPTIGSGHGFDLGDIATFGVVAFNPGKFTSTSQSPIIGNVGIGSYGSINIGNSGGIAGNVVTTGNAPSNSVCVTGNDCGLTTGYGTAGWGQNWADEAGGNNNCYSNYGCNSSTGSTVWDNFWSQNCSQTTSPLVLKVSEDAYNGDAQFTVCVDGKQVGGVYTATAKHGSSSQSINLGNYATGSNHSVAVNFLNDCYGGTSSTDRNLYVDGLTFNGSSTGGAALMSQGTQTFSVGAAAKQTLTLKVSEDEYWGNAQFTVCVDGKQVGGTYTATARHGSGSQSFNLGDYATGSSHKVTVTFLNDACNWDGDRNLYVDGLTFGSSSIGGASLCSNGGKDFTIGSTGTSSCDYTTSNCNTYNDDTWGNFFSKNNNCNNSSYFDDDYAGKAYNLVGNSSALSADIAALKSLSSTLYAEAGTSVNLASGTVLNAASGTNDAAGNEVFTVKSWSQNFTINGDGSNSVVLNIGSGITPVLGDLKLTGGLTANQVLINYTGSGTITDANSTTFNGTILAPNAKFTIDSGTINGHVLGGASGQDFTIGYNATIDAPPLQSYILTDVATVSGTYNGQTVSAFDSASVTVNPLGSGVSYDCNKPADCDNLWDKFGKVGKLEFCFKQDSGVNANDNGCGISSGSCNVGSNPCFVVVNDKADCFSSSTHYFKGSLFDGDKFFCDSSSLWDGKGGSGSFSGNNLFAHVFACQDDYLAGKSSIQENCIDVSGSHGLSIGDKIGSLNIAGYVSTNGNGYLCS